MFIRSTNSIYQIIEPLYDFGRMFILLFHFIIQLVFLGWRYNKNYFLASKTGCPPNERYLLIWVIYTIDIKRPYFPTSSVIMVWTKHWETEKSTIV